MHLHAGLKPELFEQTDAINRSTRSRDSYYNFQNRILCRNCVLISEQKCR